MGAVIYRTGSVLVSFFFFWGGVSLNSVFDRFSWLDHSAEVASQCVKWMDAGGFLGEVGAQEEA